MSSLAETLFWIYFVANLIFLSIAIGFLAAYWPKGPMDL